MSADIDEPARDQLARNVIQSLPQRQLTHIHTRTYIEGGQKSGTLFVFVEFPTPLDALYDTIRYDTIEEFNVDSKAEYSA